MRKKLIIACLLVLWFTESQSQQFNYSVAPNFDQPNNIRSYLSKAASDITNNSLCGINNLQDWENVREATLIMDERGNVNVMAPGWGNGFYRYGEWFYHAMVELLEFSGLKPEHLMSSDRIKEFEVAALGKFE